MAHEQIRMLKKFPLLLPNDNFSEYDGFFKSGSKEFYVHVSLPNAPEITDMKIIDCSWDLRLFLEENEKEVEQWKLTSSSFLNFMERLQDYFVITQSEENAEPKTEFSIKAWNMLFEELKKIGYNKVSKADREKLAWVELKVTDSADRDHLLKVNLAPADQTLQFGADIPEQALKIVQSSHSIAEAYGIFEEQVARLQTFWNVMEEIDSQCWILDPANPKLSDIKRQIAIESDISIIINVNPFNPLGMPDMNLLGSEIKVEPFQKIISNLEWPSDGDSLYEKLQSCLEISFPGQPERQELSQLSQSEMCCICLLAEMLDQRCEACNSIFHLTCLKGWLTSVPNAQTTFNRISGKCPVCQEPISCVQ